MLRVRITAWWTRSVQIRRYSDLVSSELTRIGIYLFTSRGILSVCPTLTLIITHTLNISPGLILNIIYTPLVFEIGVAAYELALSITCILAFICAFLGTIYCSAVTVGGRI